MLPVIIFVVIAIPLLILAFLGIRRSMRSSEDAAQASGISEAELEREFAAADAYEEQQREARQAPGGHS